MPLYHYIVLVYIAQSAYISFGIITVFCSFQSTIAGHKGQTRTVTAPLYSWNIFVIFPDFSDFL